ncbi:hypothetical protein SeLEV6574_g07611, partial [Synchytrium endobioticum]
SNVTHDVAVHRPLFRRMEPYNSDASTANMPERREMGFRRRQFVRNRRHPGRKPVFILMACLIPATIIHWVSNNTERIGTPWAVAVIAGLIVAFLVTGTIPRRPVDRSITNLRQLGRASNRRIIQNPVNGRLQLVIMLVQTLFETKSLLANRWEEAQRALDAALYDLTGASDFARGPTEPPDDVDEERTVYTNIAQNGNRGWQPIPHTDSLEPSSFNSLSRSTSMPSLSALREQVLTGHDNQNVNIQSRHPRLHIRADPAHNSGSFSTETAVESMPI